MKDIRSMLREGDPIAREGDLSTADSQRMRKRLQSATMLPPPTRKRSLVPLTAALVLLTAGGVWVTHRAVPQPRPRLFASAPAVGGQEPEGVRQLQFVTTGGTRVFWTFHPKTEAR
jgi:hypothetical protein